LPAFDAHCASVMVQRVEQRLGWAPLVEFKTFRFKKPSEGAPAGARVELPGRNEKNMSSLSRINNQ